MRNKTAGKIIFADGVYLAIKDLLNQLKSFKPIQAFDFLWSMGHGSNER